MLKTHHNFLMTVSIAEENLRQVPLAIFAPNKTKSGIRGLVMIMFLLITRRLLMMNKNHGIENHVVFVACITMWLSSAGREWQ